MNPGTRPRTGIALALVAVAAVAVVSLAVVASTPDEAEASGLETFASCSEFQAWGASNRMPGMTDDFGAENSFNTVGGPVAESQAAPTADAAGSSAGTSQRQSGTTGGTNVVVDGVDELDIVDRLDDRTVLAVGGGNLALVDLTSGTAVALLDVPDGAQVTFDPEARVAWVVGTPPYEFSPNDLPDMSPEEFEALSSEEQQVAELGARVTSVAGAGLLVDRVAVGSDSLTSQGQWQTDGTLVDARRVGDELYVVASDGFGSLDDGPIPFEDGPVPCTDVLHPPGQSDPTATLITALPATGDVKPLRATEVVGSGRLVHVTTEAAYLATPRWDTSTPTTMIHRFELDTLNHTGSGVVGGTLLNDFSMSEHDGNLRVAITARGAGFGPIVEEGPFIDDGPDIVDDVVPVPTPESEQNADSIEAPADLVPEGGADPSVEPTVPDSTPTTAPEATTTVPESTTTVPETTTTTTVPETTTTVPETTTTVPETTTTTTEPLPEPQPQPGPGDGLNQVVVLDTDGDLDVVGRTNWFGHEGETLHGIRFDGTTAYAVTFLQTDPFYVLDLSDPAAPRVLGEVELPGFSAYLHPVSPGRVLGFGPDENGQASAKLFDVSDPVSPQVVDSLELGSESAVVYDHHAYVDLGEGRFAVPANEWVESYPDRCTPTVRGQAQERAAELNAQLDDPTSDLPSTGQVVDGIYEELDQLYEEGCLEPTGSSRSSVVSAEVVGDELREVVRWQAGSMQQVQRVIPTDGGWALLGGDELVILDGPDDERARIVLR